MVIIVYVFVSVESGSVSVFIRNSHVLLLFFFLISKGFSLKVSNLALSSQLCSCFLLARDSYPIF